MSWAGAKIFQHPRPCSTEAIKNQIYFHFFPLFKGHITKKMLIDNGWLQDLCSCQELDATAPLRKKTLMDSEDKSTTELYKGGYSQRGRGHARESSCNVTRCYFISISTSTGTAINFIHWNFQPLPRLLCPTQPAQPVLAANINAFA